MEMVLKRLPSGCRNEVESNGGAGKMDKCLNRKVCRTMISQDTSKSLSIM